MKSETLEAIAETGERPEDTRLTRLNAIEARRFDINTPPPELKPVATLNGIAIATAGNLIPITGQAKAGKSQIAAALIASSMADNQAGVDCFGLRADNPEGKAVIHLDAEQSEPDFFRLTKGALWRAGVSKQPDWLYAYHLTGFEPEQLRDDFETVLSVAAERHGGIHFAFIDGFGDMLASPNDEAESFALVRSLHSRAEEYATPIFGVIHHNAGSESLKMRGHVGSQFERKAETVLCCKKDKEEVVTLYTTATRHAPIPENKGSRFQWSDEAKGFVSVASKSDIQADRNALKKAELVQSAFLQDAGLSHKELVSRIMQLEAIREDAAKKRVARLRNDGFLKVQPATGYYHKGDSQPC